MKKSNKHTLQNISKLEGIVSNQSKQTTLAKTDYEKLPKRMKKELKKHRDNFIVASSTTLLINFETIINLQNFIEYLLSIVFNNPSLKVRFSTAPTNTKGFIDYILKDKNFKNYIVYFLMSDAPTNIVGSNIISLLFFYVFKDKKITVSRIKHFVSMYIVKSDLDFEVKSTLNMNQKILLRQIKTGVKEEKIKNQDPSNNIEYNGKNKDFLISNIAENFIKIKYTSNLNGSHRFHKPPVEHTRSGHYRHYKSGKTVWINSSIINRRGA